jgi:hypothetical protein
VLAAQLNDLRGRLSAEGIVLLYHGVITDAVLEGIGAGLRSKLSFDGVERKKARSLFSLFVEQVQNVIRYSAEREGDDKSALRYGVLSVGKEPEGYFVFCGNVVERTDVERLRAALSSVVALDRAGVLSRYRETLKGAVPEGSKGAGVGFLEMARVAERGLEFDFLDLDERRSFFTVKART